MRILSEYDMLERDEKKSGADRGSLYAMVPTFPAPIADESSSEMIESAENDSIAGNEKKSEADRENVLRALAQIVDVPSSCAITESTGNNSIEGEEKKSEITGVTEVRSLSQFVSTISVDRSIEEKEEKNEVDQGKEVRTSSQIGDAPICEHSESVENDSIEKKEKKGDAVGGDPVTVMDPLLAAGDCCADIKPSENPLIDGREENTEDVGGNGDTVADLFRCALNPPSENALVEGIGKKREQCPIAGQINSEDSFENDDYPICDSSEAKRQKLILDDVEGEEHSSLAALNQMEDDDHFEKHGVLAARNEMEEKFKMLNRRADEYLKCFPETNKEIVEEVKTMYLMCKRIDDIINKNKEVAASKKRAFVAAHNEYRSSSSNYKKISSGNGVDYDRLVKDKKKEVDKARDSPAAYNCLFDLAMSKESSESWTRRHGERRAVTVRFFDSFKPTNEAGVGKFYELFYRCEKRTLTMYDDYLFGIGNSLRDIRFIFPTVKEAVEFNAQLRRSNFDTLGVESTKWVDINKARNSQINENSFVITRQENDDPKNKTDIMLSARNNGGLYRQRAEEGLDEMLLRMKDPTRTPPNGEKTPVKVWTSPAKEASPPKRSKSNEMASPLSPMSSTSSQEYTQRRTTAISTAAPIELREVPQTHIIPSDDKWTVDGINQHISRLKKTFMQAKKEGKKKEDTAAIKAEKEELENRLEVLEFCSGDVEEAKKMMEGSGTPV